MLQQSNSIPLFLISLLVIYYCSNVAVVVEGGGGGFDLRTPCTTKVVFPTQ